jgi:cellulose synthase/poly-beta-1,6-N-acetylglucosamine synthase-like glycosyltransferase
MLKSSWLVLTVLIAIEAFWSLIRSIRFRKFFIADLKPSSSSDPAPRVALLAPVKGLDHNLHKNIQSWLSQDYQNYRLFFVIESKADPAIQVLENFPSCEILVAGRSQDCGQKVHNLMFAINRLPAEYEVFAFVDSDVAVRKDWLRSLIQKVQQHPGDAVTGYRWFKNANDFGSILRTVWNSSVLTLFEESGRLNFAWGGSMAITQQTFFETTVLKSWQGSLSDDYGLTVALRNAGRRVHFVPAAIVITSDSIQFNEFLAWAGRQLLITRLYNPALWRAAFFYHLLWISWCMIGIAVRPVYFVIAFLLIQLTQGIKAEIRLDCMKQWGVKNPGNSIYFWLLSPVIGFVNLFLMLQNLFSRTVRWRGIEYYVSGPNQLEIKSRT